VQAARGLPLLAVLVLAACGGGGGSKTTATETTPTTTTAPSQTSVRVYFLHEGKVQPVLRVVPETKAVATAALGELVKGPTAPERTLGLTTSVPAKFDGSLDRKNGVLSLDGDDASGTALAQVVYTLTQFPSSTTVEVNGTRYTRAQFEDQTPAILPELPLPFQVVRSPLRVAGSANTFEATLDYELVDANGKVLKRGFDTATSGSGVRGTFDFTLPFTITSSGDGKLILYESSAKDGSRIHIIEVPLKLVA
jgi:hypothetical protein